MIYEGIDRWNANSSLAHYKYIKKIKIGPYTRYFYSMADLRNYYNKANEADSRVIDKHFGKDAEYDVAQTALNEGHHFGLINDQEAKGAQKAINYARGSKADTKAANKLGNRIEVGKLAIRSLFGSSSKDELKRREVDSYKSHRKSKRRSIKRTAESTVRKVNGMFGF